MSRSISENADAEQGLVGVDADEQYRMLASEQRRIVLDTLEGADSMSLDALVTEVAEQTTDVTTEQRIEIALVHQHLPLLANNGVLEFDSDTKRISHSSEPLNALLGLL